jgi:DNA-binding transcriptional LysR family regulator
VSFATLDLNLLLVLDTVLAERSVARAARRLHVTPSAVSNSLARLRAALGDPLLARKGRGIVPTPRATEFAPVLARALREIEQAVHGAIFDPKSSTRTFTLAVADVGQVVRLPRIAALFASDLPRGHLRVVGIDALVSLGGLAGTDVDVAIGAGEKGPGVHLEALFDEPTALIARRGHPATRKRLTRSGLEALRHVAIVMAPGKGMRDLSATTYARAGIARDVAVTVPTFTAAAAVVAAGDLVATLPRSLVDVFGARLGLGRVKAPAPRMTVPMYLTWHDRTHADPGMVFFRELLRRAVK